MTLSHDVEVVLNNAIQHARINSHEFITVEHLLLALLDISDICTLIHACGGNIEKLKVRISEFLESNVPTLPPGKDQESEPGNGFHRVIQRAIIQVDNSQQEEVKAEHLLVAVFAEKDCHARHFLEEEKISRLDVVSYLSHGLTKTDADTIQGEPDNEKEKKRTTTKKADRHCPLEAYTINLNERARKGLIDPLIGREREIERTIQILCRRLKNNPILVGDSGVGKTAIIEGLACMIENETVPTVLHGGVIYSLDLGALLAGTKYRGDFEQRFKQVISALENNTKAIMFVDEIHMLIGAGSASGSSMDASNLLKPTLASGQIRCIGSTTYQEYRTIFEKEHALMRRFQKVDIHEPNVSDTIEILNGLKDRFEVFHGIHYTKPALRSAAALSARHITDRFLPDKAIDLIDEAGAAYQLQPGSRRRKNITVRDIERIVSKMAQIPINAITASDKRPLKSLSRNLQLVVFGQDEAIAKLDSAIKLTYTGLNHPDRPIASFLFAGPTGVGKTELTKQLASNLAVKLVRFDMSEYMEKHSVSRLIGAPPGYIGHDQGGLLTDAINKAPHAILLLDEIEKAHPDINNILLQIMDYGMLTDNSGRRTNFRNVVLVMTTNIGGAEISRASVGFVDQDHNPDQSQQIERYFSPEFRNRLDATVYFNPLNRGTILKVVDKFLLELEEQLAEKHVTLHISDEARDWLADHGYDPKMGARPMARLIRDKLKAKIADELLFGRLGKGGTISLICQENELATTIVGSSHTSNLMDIIPSN